MKFKATITEEEFVWGLSLFLKYKSPWSFIIPPIVIFLYAITDLTVNRYSPKLSLIVIFSVLIYVIGIPWLTYYKAKKSYNTDPFPEIEYEFTHDYMVFNRPNSKTERNWANIDKIEENKYLFLFYTNKQVAEVVPKNSLSNEQINALRAIFRGIDTVKIKKLKN